MIYKLKDLIDKIPTRLFLMVWPPYKEDRMSDTDISLGLVFSEDSKNLIVISTDKNDLTTPYISYEGIPKHIFSFSEFTNRIKKWMHGEKQGCIDYEYYEGTKDLIFKNIVFNKILNIQYINIKKSYNPLGIKLIFQNDYIISSPISDGNTIETKYFNTSNNLSHFQALGEIEYLNLK